MVLLKAKKQINVHTLTCLGNIKIPEKRLDLIWLLENIGRWGYSRGVEQNLLKYLENYLGVLTNGALNKQGREAIKNGYVLIPESGLYRIFYISDSILRDQLISFKRIKPRKSLDKRKTVPFEPYQKFDQGYYLNWNDHTSFYFEFRKGDRENPPVIKGRILVADFELQSSSDSTEYNVTVESKKLRFEQKNYSEFLLQENIKHIVKNYNEKYNSIEVSFEEIHDSNSISTFSMKKILNVQSLEFSWGSDKSNYQVEISDIKLIPKTEADAIKWIKTLVVKKLEQTRGYYSLPFIKKIEQEFIKKSNFLQKFPNLEVPNHDYYNLDQNHIHISRKLYLAEDLNPEVFI